MTEEIDYIEDDGDEWSTTQADGYYQTTYDEDDKLEMLKEKINHLILLFKTLEQEVSEDPL